MTFTIGAVLLKLLITGAVTFIAGFLVGANWFKRKGNGGTIKDALKSSYKEDMKKLEEAYFKGKAELDAKYKDRS